MAFGKKSTIEQIRKRFDADVERFSNLDTGQKAAIDAPLMLELLAQSAARATPGARSVLDIGCGAGNQTLMLLRYLPGLDCTLVDLSEPMIARARQRVEEATRGKVIALAGDIREVPLEEGSFDIILAGAVLHHLREDEDWRRVFTRLHKLLRPGGGLWISDMVDHHLPALRRLFRERYGDYLCTHGDDDYVRKVFAYIEEEDTPRPLPWQLQLLRDVGFAQVEVLHKNGPFAAFGAVKG